MINKCRKQEKHILVFKKNVQAIKHILKTKMRCDFTILVGKKTDKIQYW